MGFLPLPFAARGEKMKVQASSFFPLRITPLPPSSLLLNQPLGLSGMPTASEEEGGNRKKTEGGGGKRRILKPPSSSFSRCCDARERGNFPLLPYL